MKRRIVILAYTKHQHDTFMSGLTAALMRAGHEVRVVFKWGEATADNEFRTDYDDFNLLPIEEFCPDRLIIFNGFDRETFGVTSFLRGRYKTFFVERGWLPQKDNIYIDQQGLGGRSSLAQADLSYAKLLSNRVEKTIGELRETHYSTAGHPELGDYILLPLQLDHDTSIVLDSPYFKTMHSLVAFIQRKFYDQKIIVRPHPYNLDIQLPPEVIVEKTKRTIDLAKTAKAIIGINSTTLIESLIFHKPVAFLGRGVLSGTSQICYPPDLSLQFAENILGRFTPNTTRIDHALFSLLNKQFKASEPPSTVIKQIEV